MRSFVTGNEVVLKHEPSGAFVGTGFALTDRAGALVLVDRDAAHALLVRHAPMPHFVVLPAGDESEAAA